MKVAFWVTTFPSSSQTFVLNQVKSLIDAGVEVHIYAKTRDYLYKELPDNSKYDLAKRIFYIPITSKNLFFRLFFGILITAKNVRKKRLNIFKSLNLFKYGFSAISLKLLYYSSFFFDKEPYDLFHCHFGPNGLTFSQLKDIGVLKCPSITTFHGYDANVIPNSMRKGYYKLLMQNTDLVTVGSTFMKNQVLRIGANPDKVMKMPMGVNLEKFKFKRRSFDFFTSSTIRILTVSRLSEEKGIKYAIRAVAELLKTYPQLEYNVIGEGGEKDSLLHLTVGMGIEKNVNLLGVRSQDEVIQAYCDSHIFILPSIKTKKGDEEGQGLVLIEAQATGLPVISTNIGGIPDSFLDGKSGFLVSQKNHCELASRIEFLIKNPEVCSHMGECGRAYIEKKFDHEKLKREMIKIYENIIYKARASSA